MSSPWWGGSAHRDAGWQNMQQECLAGHNQIQIWLGTTRSSSQLSSQNCAIIIHSAKGV